LNKSKQKRQQREIDRLYRTGRFWDWVEEVDRMGLGETYSREWLEVWKTLAKRALRLLPTLEEFWERGARISRVPDHPDVTFLFLLKNFLEGKDGFGPLSALQGLSPSAGLLWEKALSWDESQFPKKKIQGILSKFLISPGKVKPEEYQSLDLQIKSARLPALYPAWGDPLALLRTLGDGRKAHQGFSRTQSSRLVFLDRAIQGFSRRYPPALFRLLLQPLVFQTARLLTSLGAIEPHSAAEFVKAVPFLFSVLAGPQAAGIQERLSVFEPAPSNRIDWQLRIEQARRETLENRVALLGRMRSLLPAGISEDLRGPFQNLYLEVLGELADRQARLPIREQGELGRVLERVVTLDGHLFWDRLEEKPDLDRPAEFLKRAAVLGALRVKPALVALLISERVRDYTLRDQALAVLKESPPSREDLSWLLKECENYVMFRPRALKPILDLPEGPLSLQSWAAAWWLTQLDQPLYLNSGMSLGGEFLFDGEAEWAEAGKRLWAFLSFELQGFKEYANFSVVLDYLKSFPGASFSDQGFRRFLQMRMEKTEDPSFLIDWLFGAVSRTLSSLELSREDPLAPCLWALYARQEQVIFELLNEQTDLIKATPLAKIQNLIDLIDRARPRQSATLLIRIGRFLGERLRSGELEAGPLEEEIRRLLLEMKKPRKRTCQPKKRPLRS
jgi:hypothetical protein